MMALKSFFFIGICIITHLGFSQKGVAVDTSRVFRFECEVPDVEEAEFPNGFEKMREYLEENKRNIINPRTQSEYTVDEQRESERVILRFAIDTNGKVTNVVLEVGLPNCEACNQEALRLVENMPNWKPSKENGKPFYSLVRLPITFELENEMDELGCELEIDPEFKGGEKALIKYIKKNSWVSGNRKWRKSIPKDEHIEGGRVYVRFVIEADGRVSDVQLEHRLPHCEPCNQEAIRLITYMPKWEPARKKEKAVRSEVRIPILFELD
jgi:TonB family protein